MLPLSLYRIDVIGSDGIFLRGLSGGGNVLSNLASEQDSHTIFDGLELFVKYLGWVLIPNFIIFIPLGLFLIFRDRTFEKNTIILSLGIMLLPPLYAYTIAYAMDTRYLYVLFPMFSVLSVLAINRIIKRYDKSNIIIVVLISSIIVSSVIFYDYKKVDYQHELESFEIMHQLSLRIDGVNALYPESTHLLTSQTIDEWPNSYTDIRLNMTGTSVIHTNNFDSLDDYIAQSRDAGLTHILIDEKQTHPDFLLDVFTSEENYTYLDKVYDSKSDGYDHHVKIFEINYDLFVDHVE